MLDRDQVEDSASTSGNVHVSSQFVSPRFAFLRISRVCLGVKRRVHVDQIDQFRVHATHDVRTATCRTVQLSKPRNIIVSRVSPIAEKLEKFSTISKTTPHATHRCQNIGENDSFSIRNDNASSRQTVFSLLVNIYKGFEDSFQRSAGAFHLFLAVSLESPPQYKCHDSGNADYRGNRPRHKSSTGHWLANNNIQ